MSGGSLAAEIPLDVDELLFFRARVRGVDRWGTRVFWKKHAPKFANFKLHLIDWLKIDVLS